MTEFDQLCEEFEAMSPEEYLQTMEDMKADVIPVLAEMRDGEDTALQIFGYFVLASCVADGKLSEEEYMLAAPHFEDFFGDRLSYEACKDFVRRNKGEREDLKSFADVMSAFYGRIDEDLKYDMVVICLLVCAADGKISLKERNWIRRIIR